MRAVVLVLAATACGRASFDARTDAATPDASTPVSDSGDRVYSDFSTCPDDVVLQGTASCTQPTLELTPLVPDVAGALWIAQTYATGVSFSVEATVTMRTLGVGADGMAFVMHADPRGLDAIGLPGIGLGYQSISPSLGLELDEFANSLNGESEPHIGAHEDGDINLSLAMVPAPLPLSDGQPITMWVDYDAASTQIAVFVARTQKPAAPAFTLTHDLRRLGATMWLGMTASTGTNTSEHRVQALRIDVHP